MNCISSKCRILYFKKHHSETEKADYGIGENICKLFRKLKETHIFVWKSSVRERCLCSLWREWCLAHSRGSVSVFSTETDVIVWWHSHELFIMCKMKCGANASRCFHTSLSKKPLVWKWNVHSVHPSATASVGWEVLPWSPVHKNKYCRRVLA